MKMTNFLSMSYPEALKLYVDVFQGKRSDKIQAGNSIYAMVSGDYITGITEKVTFVLESISRDEEAATERTIKIEFRRRRYG